MELTPRALGAQANTERGVESKAGIVKGSHRGMLLSLPVIPAHPHLTRCES